MFMFYFWIPHPAGGGRRAAAVEGGSEVLRTKAFRCLARVGCWLLVAAAAAIGDQCGDWPAAELRDARGTGGGWIGTARSGARDRHRRQCDARLRRYQFSVGHLLSLSRADGQSGQSHALMSITFDCGPKFRALWQAQVKLLRVW